MDPDLLEVARAAEEGTRFPEIRLFAGGHFFQGTPGPSRSFIEASRIALVRDFEIELARRPRRQRKQDPRDPEELTHHLLAPFRRFRAQHDDAPVLTLVNARWWPLVAGGSGLALPAVRVPVASVTAWWIAGAVEVPPEGA